jgi:CoA:oxalate CoA-transferase
LKTTAGVEAALDIASQSDVVVENWRPGVAHRLGVGFDQVSAVRPDTVYCSISGFGQTGPKSQRPAYAPIVHAASGYDLAQVEYQGGGRPANTAIFIGDVFGGMSSFAAIQTALLDRERTGRGRFIDVSMLDGMMNLMVFETLEIQTPSPVKLRVYQPLEASDGFIIVAPTSQKNFEKLAHCLEQPEWLSDPRFKTTKIREEHWDELMRLIESWTRRRSAQVCEETLLAAGVPCTRYLKVGEAMKDPQIIARGTFTPLTDDAGTYLVPNAPYQFAGMPTPVRNEVAKLGEHTEQILAEFRGTRGKRKA